MSEALFRQARHIDHELDKIPVVELSRDELVQPSGVFDEELGREMTNFEFTDWYERTYNDSQGVFVDDTNYLSEDAREQNRQLHYQRRYHRDGLGGGQMVALVSRRLTNEQRQYRNALRAEYAVLQPTEESSTKSVKRAHHATRGLHGRNSHGVHVQHRLLSDRS